MKIVALTGLLGYGYTEEGLKKAFEQDIDCIGVDGGSTDPGPYYLGSGKTLFTKEAMKNDIKRALPLALERKIPFIMGTSGGAGGEPHLEATRRIVEEIASELGLKMNVALIHSELSKEYVKEKLSNGKVIPFSDQIVLTENAIEDSERLVGQVGVEPFIKALEKGVDLILAGRACDTAIYASLPILKGYDKGLAYHMAKIVECGALCAYPAGADVIVAEIKDDHFILEPANPIRKCLVNRVAAHTLYEQTTPYYIYEPEGYADLRKSEYEQITDRSVKVMKSAFVPAEKKTIKIEGSILVGYRTICIAGVNEQAYIDRAEEIIELVKQQTFSSLGNSIEKDNYSLNFRIFGGTKDGNVIKVANCDMGIVLDVVGKTQEMANFVCATARGILLHYDYPGRKTTAGNMALQYSPSDLELGPVYEFSAYHLIEVEDYSETYSIEYLTIGGEK